MKRALLTLILSLIAMISMAQTTNVPDANFESYLETNGMGNGINGDHLVTTANISSVTYLGVNGLNISDLTGIEDFISLTDLSCSDNNLTTLILPPVPRLANLIAERNNLTTIILPSTLKEILEFGCSDNKLTNINFENVTYINFLGLDNNKFTTLDFSNTDVEGLFFTNNPLLTSIDLRNGADYTEIYGFGGGNNPLLTCVFVDDVPYAKANWNNGVDSHTNFVSDQAGCTFENTYTYVPDNNFEQALIDEGLDNVLDDYVVTNNINSIGFLNVSNKNITDLTGIEDFTELETFGCSNNQITTIDLSNNHILEFGCNNNLLTSLILNADAAVVDCSTNLLVALNVPTGIANLQCNDNNLTSLDLSNTTELSRLNVSNNNLDFLDFRNGENVQISSSYDFRTGYDYSFDARNNPDLTCIFVDDAGFSTLNWKKTDATSHFVNDQAGCDAASVETTYIPDDNFEIYLETHNANGNIVALGNANSMGNGVIDDNMVPTANIENVTIMYLVNLNIADLTGISGFTSLTHLTCEQNNLTTLDIRTNTTLTSLNCAQNNLTTLDVSANTALTHLECIRNDLTTLDVSSNIALTNLTCFGNELTNLDITANSALTYLNCEENNLSTLNVSENTDLTILYCSDNEISTLDLSNNTVLTTLWCHNNDLTALDTSMNRALTQLMCYRNNLTTLDVRNITVSKIETTYFNTLYNPSLTCIYTDDVMAAETNWTNIDATSNFVLDQAGCDAASVQTTYVPDDNFEQALIDLGYDSGTLDNYVTTANINTIEVLDVSSKHISNLTGIEDFTALLNLNCQENSLTSLDVTNNTFLNHLNFSFNQITNIDVSNNTALEILEGGFNELTGLNVTNNPDLKRLDCWINKISSVDLTQNTLLEELALNDNPLDSLEINLNIKLKEVSFGGNSKARSRVSSINVSQNPELTLLNFVYTQITDLDISNQLNLTTLFIHNNYLKNIDVSKNPVLTDLVCNNNQLEMLNMKNGNNINFTRFKAQNNWQLNCIEVDDPNWSTTNWTDVDNQITFGGNCHYFETYVPDNNFEQALINLGYDSGTLDDYVLTKNIKSIDSLNVSNKNILDITGLEDFKAITYLNVAHNTLTDLSLFENQYLITLMCNHNQLTSLEFFNNMNLVKVYCNDNQLTRLEYLYYSYDLNYLDCSNNELTDLFIGNNPNLESLYTANNLLPYLDIVGNTKLTKLNASQNKLTTLDVRNGNNINFTEFTSINNPNLTCIYADNVAWSTTNWTNIDANSNFVEDEAACTSLAINNFDFKGFKILSNPVTDYINLSIEEEANYTLIDLNGKMVKKGELSIGYNAIKISKYSNGIYFLRINNSRKSTTEKILIH